MPAVTQQYPTKPVLVIEPFGAGGGPDLLARASRSAALKAVGPNCDRGERSWSRSHRRPGTSREVATRRVYVASHHQCSSIQRCLLKESAV